jgi:hypothetical protein
MAAKKKEFSPNPITGKGPNEFTAVQSDTSVEIPEGLNKADRAPLLRQARILPDPKSPRPFTPHRMPDPEGSTTASGNTRMVPDVRATRREATRLRALHQKATAPGGAVDAEIGYRPPEGMSSANFSWLTGAHHMFPNEGAARNNPAINEPHEHDSAITVQRRAEDLSGEEYGKAADILGHYGHGKKDPVGSLQETHTRELHRVIGEHIQAGVEESASQKFYGGQTQTRIPSHPELEDVHEQAVKEVSSRVSQDVRETAMHPDFIAATPQLSHRERMHASTAIHLQAAADTSPQNSFAVPSPEGTRFPNLDQAREAVRSAVEGRPTEKAGFSGFHENALKAASRVDDMINTGNFDTHHVGNPDTAPKTVSFRSALTDPDHPDAYKVTDVHEAGMMLPGLSTAKSHIHTDRATGSDTPVYADDPPSAKKGKTQKYETEPGTGRIKPVWGKSRSEAMLEAGKPGVHALNDYATRKVVTAAGLSRGENYADNVNQVQAATWGSQQVSRPDVKISHATQYPVVRDWAAEGGAELNDLGKSFFGGSEPKRDSMGPQFRLNPNTSQTKNPTKGQPYPVMPGE